MRTAPVVDAVVDGVCEDEAKEGGADVVVFSSVADLVDEVFCVVVCAGDVVVVVDVLVVVLKAGDDVADVDRGMAVDVLTSSVGVDSSVVSVGPEVLVACFSI